MDHGNLRREGIKDSQITGQKSLFQVRYKGDGCIGQPLGEGYALNKRILQGVTNINREE